MHFGLIFAMEEEASILKKIFLKKAEVIKGNNYKILRYYKSNLTFTVIISGIGKVFAASAATILIEIYNIDAVVNIGSAGGVNCSIGDIVISNQAMYHDVDVTAFGYSKGQIPGQPVVFKSKEQIFKINSMVTKKLQEKSVITGCIATGDKFISSTEIINNIKKCNSSIKALEMEAAAIAQVCYNYNKEFIFIKKISDLADSDASQSFKKEIVNFDNKVSELIKQLLYIN